MDLGRLGPGGDNRSPSNDSHDGLHMDGLVADGRAIQHEGSATRLCRAGGGHPGGPAFAGEVFDGEQTGLAHRRRTGDQLHPDVIGDCPPVRQRQRLRVHRGDGHLALITGLADDQGVMACLPDHVCQVLKAFTVIPGDVAACAVEVEQQQVDQGVCRASRRVANLVRLPAGVGRVGDPPGGDRSVIHSGNHELVSRRTPPETTAALHFLCSDELGPAEADGGQC